MDEHLQVKMQNLMYALTKNAARSSYQEFLENMEISEDDYATIKLEWEEKLSVKPYV